MWQAGATLHRGAQASHYHGLSCCGAQALDAQAQQLWLTGLVAPRHVGTSQTRARTRVPCVGRQTLNHCTTREAPRYHFLSCLLRRKISMNIKVESSNFSLVIFFKNNTLHSPPRPGEASPCPPPAGVDVIVLC